LLNANIDEEKQEVIYNEHINLGVAIDRMGRRST
jgi:pyruvate/2-oxoglutarate dehydrogenase complex dihydrolipoamide acyltransferase (E2) component